MTDPQWHERPSGGEGFQRALRGAQRARSPLCGTSGMEVMRERLSPREHGESKRNLGEPEGNAGEAERNLGEPKGNAGEPEVKAGAKTNWAAPRQTGLRHDIQGCGTSSCHGHRDSSTCLKTGKNGHPHQSGRIGVFLLVIERRWEQVRGPDGAPVGTGPWS